MDRNKFRKKMLFKLANSPVSLLPFVGGATGLIISAVAETGFLAFASLVLMLGGIGVFFTRLIMGDEKVSQKVMLELEEEDAEARKDALDDLRECLIADGDPRTEKLLGDLVMLTEQFRKQLKAKSWSNKLNAQSTFDILSNMEDLFRSCIRTFEQSLELWNAAYEISVSAARRPLLKRREESIEEIKKSVQKLSLIFAEVQRIIVGENSDDGLERIRQELDTSLEIARRVEERIGTDVITKKEKEEY